MNFRPSVVNVCQADEISKHLSSYGPRMSENFPKT